VFYHPPPCPPFLHGGILPTVFYLIFFFRKNSKTSGSPVSAIPPLSITLEQDVPTFYLGKLFPSPTLLVAPVASGRLQIESPFYVFSPFFFPVIFMTDLVIWTSPSSEISPLCSPRNPYTPLPDDYFNPPRGNPYYLYFLLPFCSRDLFDKLWFVDEPDDLSLWNGDFFFSPILLLFLPPYFGPCAILGVILCLPPPFALRSFSLPFPLAAGDPCHAQSDGPSVSLVIFLALIAMGMSLLLEFPREDTIFLFFFLLAG